MKKGKLIWHTQHKCFYTLLGEEYDIIGAYRATREDDKLNVYTIDSDYFHETAKEMFEKLGYDLDVDVEDGEITYIKVSDSRTATYFVDFYLDDKSYYAYGFAKGHDINNPIDMEMHKAIDQQLKELRWVE